MSSEDFHAILLPCQKEQCIRRIQTDHEDQFCQTAADRVHVQLLLNLQIMSLYSHP